MYRPILFNTEMVNAIIAGWKTTTRRVVKARGWEITGIPSWAMFRQNPDDFFFNVCKTDREAMATTATCIKIDPPALPGDILWVRETWTALPVSPGGHTRIPDVYYYKAGPELRPESWRGNWHPSIHMPKDAARLFLRVKRVRVERLMDIDIDGIKAEGISSMNALAGNENMAFHEWELLWDSTIKPDDLDHYRWDANPWVWVIEFEPIAKPDDWLSEVK